LLLAAVLSLAGVAAVAAPPLRLVGSDGVTYTLAVPARPLGAGVSVGPLYNAVPKNPLLLFKPDARWLQTPATNRAPRMIPVLRDTKEARGTVR